MPIKKGKRSKAQQGGWFYEQSDPIFGKSNKWIAKQAGYIDYGLRKHKILSTLAPPLAGMAPSLGSFHPLVGTVAGAAAAGRKK